MIRFYLCLKLKSAGSPVAVRPGTVLLDRNRSRRIFILGGKSWKKKQNCGVFRGKRRKI